MQTDRLGGDLKGDWVGLEVSGTDSGADEIPGGSEDAAAAQRSRFSVFNHAVQHTD